MLNRKRGFSGKGSTHDPKFKKFREYAYPILMKHSTKTLFTNKIKFKEFWQRYCSVYNKSEDIIFKAVIIDRFISQYFSKIRADGLPSEVEKQKLKNFDENNEIVIARHKVKYTKNNKKKNQKGEVTQEVVSERTVTRDQIKEIRFSHESTRSTVKRITEIVEFKQKFTSDYLYFLNGGTDEFEKLPDGTERKRFKDQLSHVALSGQFRNEINKLAQQLLQNINSLDSVARVNLTKKLDIIEQTLKTARNIDSQPIYFLNTLEEGEFNAQKVLNGAIVNDKLMLDNGQIIIKDASGKGELNEKNFKDDLELIGSSVQNSHILTLQDQESSNIGNLDNLVAVNE